MKKTMTIFKTMLMAAVVFVMAQGCVPAPVGGGPTPTSGKLKLWAPRERMPISMFPGMPVVPSPIRGFHTIEVHRDVDNSLVVSRLHYYTGNDLGNIQYFDLEPGTYYLKFGHISGFRIFNSNGNGEEKYRSSRFTITTNNIREVNIEFDDFHLFLTEENVESK